MRFEGNCATRLKAFADHALLLARIKLENFLPKDSAGKITKQLNKFTRKFIDHLGVLFLKLLIFLFCLMAKWVDERCVEEIISRDKGPETLPAQLKVIAFVRRTILAVTTAIDSDNRGGARGVCPQDTFGLLEVINHPLQLT